MFPVFSCNNSSDRRNRNAVFAAQLSFIEKSVRPFLANFQNFSVGKFSFAVLFALEYLIWEIATPVIFTPLRSRLNNLAMLFAAGLAALCVAVSSIFRMRAIKKMFGIAAWRIVASVAGVVFGPFSRGEVKSNSACRVFSGMVSSELTIAAISKASCPQPAIAVRPPTWLFADFAPESLNGLFGKIWRGTLWLRHTLKFSFKCFSLCLEPRNRCKLLPGSTCIIAQKALIYGVF